MRPWQKIAGSDGYGLRITFARRILELDIVGEIKKLKAQDGSEL